MNNQTLHEDTQNIINLSLSALQRELGDYPIHALWLHEIDCGIFDTVVSINKVPFACEIKGNLTMSSFNHILERLHANKHSTDMPCLLLTKYISPSLLQKCKETDINVLDCVGNFYIRYEKNGHLVFWMSNSGKKAPLAYKKSSRLFSKTNLKVIFYLLNEPENVNKSYREIQIATGVSLGSIQNLIKELIDKNYILTTPNGRFLKNQKELLEQWSINYNQILKPDLLLDKMSFRTADDRAQWRRMKLPEGMYWGGECGSHKLNEYLQPGSFDIYTEIPAAHLLQTRYVRQDPQGEICLYRKFWKDHSENEVVPPVIIYADLMGSGEARCLDSAQRLLEHELRNFR